MFSITEFIKSRLNIILIGLGIFIILITALIIFLFLPKQTTPEKTQNNILSEDNTSSSTLYATLECKDTDGGETPLKKGIIWGQESVCINDNCKAVKYIDKCENNKNLTEYFCNQQGYIESQIIECDGNCLYGKCLPQKINPPVVSPTPSPVATPVKISSVKLTPPPVPSNISNTQKTKKITVILDKKYHSKSYSIKTPIELYKGTKEKNTLKIQNIENAQYVFLLDENANITLATVVFPSQKESVINETTTAIFLIYKTLKQQNIPEKQILEIIKQAVQAESFTVLKTLIEKEKIIVPNQEIQNKTELLLQEIKEKT